MLRVRAYSGRSLTTSIMTVINNNIYKLRGEMGLVTMVFNRFKTSGGLPQPPATPGKDILISFRRKKLLIIKTAAFRFERLG